MSRRFKNLIILWKKIHVVIFLVAICRAVNVFKTSKKVDIHGTIGLLVDARVLKEVFAGFARVFRDRALECEPCLAGPC